MIPNKNNNQIMVLHTGDDPTSGGIQRVSSDILSILKSEKILGPVISPKSNKIFWVLDYLIKSLGWKGNTLVLHSAVTKLFWIYLPKKKIYLFMHGIEVWKKIPWFQENRMKKISKLLFNSQFTRDKFYSINPDFSHIPHAVVNLGLGTKSELFEPDFTKPSALIIGRLSEEGQKGHSQIIQSWNTVQKLVPGAELWIVGDGYLRGQLEFEASSNASIKFFGKVSQAEKEVLLKKCCCFVMPSRSEGFGLVYIEAMRFGKPCLVSEEDAGREVVNPPECGLSVQQSDIGEIAKKIAFLIQKSPERQIMALNAKNRYDSFFTFEHFKSRLISALSD